MHNGERRERVCTQKAQTCERRSVERPLVTREHSIRGLGPWSGSLRQRASALNRHDACLMHHQLLCGPSPLLREQRERVGPNRGSEWHNCIGLCDQDSFLC